MIGVILAGGLARRMGGGDKSLRTLGGRPVLDRVIERLSPQVDRVILNANGDAARFADYNVPVVSDSIKGFAGPLAGVLAGMDYAAEHGVGSIVTVAADTPFFPADVVNRFVAQKPFAMAATPDAKRGTSRHPTFALWPVELRDDLRAALNDGVRKVIAWSDRHGCQDVMFDVEPFDPFFNVNTPEDMAQAELLLQEYAA